MCIRDRTYTDRTTCPSQWTTNASQCQYVTGGGGGGGGGSCKKYLCCRNDNADFCTYSSSGSMSNYTCACWEY